MDGSTIDTAHAGLFYLLGLALELSLGEIAWKQCLRESVFLGRVAAVLTGPDAAGDPAAELFGGAPPDAALALIDGDRLAEMTGAMLAAVAGALPRRGLASLPSVEWSLSHVAGGRLLIALASGTDLPLFAWPASGAAALEDGFRRFVEVWPERGHAAAHPALADADPTRQVTADMRVPLSRPALIADEGDLQGTAAVTQAAGSLAYLFSARLSPAAPASMAALRARYLAAPARVTRDRERMTVLLPPERIDLALRRAGLDRSPGWVPWLQRDVRIEYGELPDAGID